MVQTSSIKTLKKSDIKMQAFKLNETAQKTKSTSTSQTKLKMAGSSTCKNEDLFDKDKLSETSKKKGLTKTLTKKSLAKLETSDKAK